MIFLAVGALVRLIPSFVYAFVVNHDTIGWTTVGALTVQGKNIYPWPAYEYYAFFPAFLYINAAAVWLGRLGIPPMFVNKAVVSLFDIGNIWLVYLLTKKNKKAAWLYALNPVSIMVTAIHGQLEAIPVFFLLLGIYLLEKKKAVWSGIALSFAIVFKTWPLLFAIPLMKRVWKWWYVALLAAVPFAAMLVYSIAFRAKPVDIIHYTLFYRGQVADFGIGYFFKWLITDKMSLRIFSNAFLLLFASYSFFNRQKTVSEEVLDQLLFFFILSPTFGLQWLMWIVPLLIIVRPRWYYLYFIAATLYIGNVNVFWILGERDLGFVKYVSLFGLATWASMGVIALFRRVSLRPYIVVAKKDLLSDEGSKKQHADGQ